MATSTWSAWMTKASPPSSGRRRPERSNSPSRMGRHLMPATRRPSSDDFHRRGQQPQLHALVLGLFDFFLVGGHGLAAAAVDDGDVLGAEPQGGAGGVDGRVAAADHHHVLAHRHRAAEVVGAEEGEGVGDAFGVVAGHAQAHARRRADAEEHGVVAFGPQRLEREVLAQHHVR